MEILKENKNPLLQRTEVQFSLESEANPGEAHVLEKIAEHFKTEKELITLKRVASNFGKSEFLIDAFIYENMDARKIEPMPKTKKKAEQQIQVQTPIAGGKK